MHNYVKRRMECFKRVKLFGQKPDLVLTSAEIALFTNLGVLLTAMQGSGATQADGRRGFREGTAERRAARKDLRAAMRDISEIAKSLREEGIDPGAAERFRLPGSVSFVALAAVARGFAAAVEPQKAVFIARGLAATFVEDLEALVALVESSGDVRETGRGHWVGGTASLESVADAGMKKVRQLRASMRVKLRNDAALLAEWTTAARVHRAVSATETEDDGSGGGGGSTPPAGS